ncbi:hypothetical protein XENOCAPTIV_008548, partial [Xenoophorus captivus]
TQMDELKAAQTERNKRELAEQRRGFGAQSVSCLKELYDLQRDRYLTHSDGLWLPQSFLCDADSPFPKEENQALQRSIQTLQRQIATERSRREAAEQEIELTSRENLGLEQRLVQLEGCWARQTELEEEVEQLRLLWRATRRAQAVKQRGISLLNEVDAQYSALQVKYEELLQCYHQATDGLSHKAVQTSSGSFANARARRRLSNSAAPSDLKVLPEDNQQPEYKVLFKEIFTRIQKTKEDISENRHPAHDSDSAE